MELVRPRLGLGVWMQAILWCIVTGVLMAAIGFSMDLPHLPCFAVGVVLNVVWSLAYCIHFRLFTPRRLLVDDRGIEVERGNEEKLRIRWQLIKAATRSSGLLGEKWTFECPDYDFVLRQHWIKPGDWQQLCSVISGILRDRECRSLS